MARRNNFSFAKYFFQLLSARFVALEVCSDVVCNFAGHSDILGQPSAANIFYKALRIALNHLREEQYRAGIQGHQHSDVCFKHDARDRVIARFSVGNIRDLSRERTTTLSAHASPACMPERALRTAQQPACRAQLVPAVTEIENQTAA